MTRAGLVKTLRVNGYESFTVSNGARVSDLYDTAMKYLHRVGESFISM